MEGLITLSESILCKSEVLGQILNTTIADVEVSVHFPQLPVFEKKDSQQRIINPLLPPEIAKAWKRGNIPLSWGYPQNYPTGNSSVDLLAITINCDEHEIEKKAILLYSGINAWVKSFVDYLVISTKQKTVRNKNKENNTYASLEFLELGNMEGSIIKKLYGFIPRDDSFASMNQIVQALRFADSGKELHTEYQMLLSAYKARRDCLNRQAIIDACSAVDLCLVKNITRLIKGLKMDPEFFLDKYGSLGNRFDLIKQLDRSFPNDDQQQLIVKPRNDVAHNREVHPSDDTTDKLISCVEGCLEHFFTGYY